MAEDRRSRLAAARLYLCTGARRHEGDLAEFLDAVLAGGVDVVQLREKHLEAREELALCEMFADAAARHGALWSVNDRADVAFAARPDILHLGQDDLPVAVARDILGPDVLIGRSTHAAHEVDRARTESGVDYFCVGPTWPTPTKPGRPAPGLALLRHAAAGPPGGTTSPEDPLSSVSPVPPERPWFAIGGIDLDRLDDVLATGARRVVVVRAITEAPDPGAAAAAFARRLAAA